MELLYRLEVYDCEIASMCFEKSVYTDKDKSSFETSVTDFEENRLAYRTSWSRELDISHVKTNFAYAYQWYASYAEMKLYFTDSNHKRSEVKSEEELAYLMGGSEND